MSLKFSLLVSLAFFYSRQCLSQTCNSLPPCFSIEYSPCQSHNITTGLEYVRINLSVPLSEVDEPGLLQAITAVVCHSVINSDNITLCWDLVMGSPSYQQRNCSSILVAIVDLGHSIPARTLQNVLLRDSSQLALNVAGYSLCGISIDDVNESVLAQIPIFSWVCLGFGLVISGLILSKPVWWDRLLIRVCSARGKERRQQEENG